MHSHAICDPPASFQLFFHCMCTFCSKYCDILLQPAFFILVLRGLLVVFFLSVLDSVSCTAVPYGDK